MSTRLHLTTADYEHMVKVGAFDHLQRKIELIRGELREMNPAGPLHDDLIAFLIDWSVRSTDRNIIRVTAQTGLALPDQESRPEPDLLWLRADRYRSSHPTARDVRLAIEVADRSLQSDLIEKGSLYAEAGIVEYWIVDAQGQCIHTFRSPRTGTYAERHLVRLGEKLMPLAPCSAPLVLHELFRG